MKDVESANQKFVNLKGFKIKEYIFASTFKRDPKIQDKCIELSKKYKFKISYWWWDDINELIQKHWEIMRAYYPELYRPKGKLLSVLPWKNETFIWREKDLELLKVFCQNNWLVQIKGMGWIWKSGLSIEYLHRNVENYDYVAYIESAGNLKLSMVTSFEKCIEPKNSDLDWKFEEIVLGLSWIVWKKLIIIDNVLNPEDLILIKPLTWSCTVLITSRYDFDIINKINVDVLSPELSKKLFLKHYKKQAADSAEIDNLLESLWYHTLFIELVSKVLNTSKIHSIWEFINKFKSWKFWTIKESPDKSFNDLLNWLFKIDNASKEEIEALSKISLLPAKDIGFESICKNLHIIGKEEIETFELILLELAKKWWVSETVEWFKMHQIIKEYILWNIKQDHNFIVSLIDKIYNYTNGIFRTNPLSLLNEVEYIESICSSVRIVDKVTEMKSLDMLIKVFWNLDERIKMGTYSKKLEELTSRNSLFSRFFSFFWFSISWEWPIYANLSIFNLSLWNYDSARKYIQMAIQNTGFLDLEQRANVYSNAWIVYEELWEFETALKYVNKWFKLAKRSETIFFLNDTLSMIELEKWLLDSALKHSEIALKIWEEIYINWHPELWKIYSNIALIYQEKWETDNAILFIKKSIKMRELFNKDNYTLLAQSYYNYAYIIVWGLMIKWTWDVNEALNYAQKAFDIYKNVYWDKPLD